MSCEDPVTLERHPEPHDALGHEYVSHGGWADGSTFTYCVRCGMPPLQLPCRPSLRRRLLARFPFLRRIIRG